MAYNFDFSIASFIFLAVVVFFYFREPHVKSTQTFIFKLMLFNGLLGAFMDVLAAVTDDNPENLSLFVLYLINIVFLISTQLCTYLFASYTLVITGYYGRMKNYVKAILALPLVFNIILVIASAFNDSLIFHLDADKHYFRADLYASLYIVSIFYAIIVGTVVIKAYKKIQASKVHVILFDMVALIVAMCIQLTTFGILLNHTANCLSIVVFYLCLEAPNQNTDSVTGAFNNVGFGLLMREKFEQQEDFGLILFNLRNTAELGTKFGKRINDAIVSDFFEDIKHMFPSNIIAHVDRSVFAVVLNSSVITRELLDIYDAKLKTTFAIGDGEILIPHQTAGISSTECGSRERLFTTLEYVNQQFNEKKETLIIADKDFYEVFDKRAKITAAVERTIAENSVQVYYQPVHYGQEQVNFLEALARINDPELGFIDPETFIKIAEEEGTIVTLGKQILEKAAAFISKGVLEHFDIEYVSINLSVGQCMDKNVCDDLTEIVDRYNVKHNRICFEITETQAMESIRVVQRTMKDLIARGFKLSLDDFGTGYSNFNYLFQFPFDNVKLDKSLLWDSMVDERKGQLFASITRAIDDLELSCICEGVETEEHIKWLDYLGVHLHQGYYYSKPVPEDKLLIYLSDNVR